MPSKPARRVNIDAEYQVDRFRPKYADRLGEPMLLTQLPAAVPVA